MGRLPLVLSSSLDFSPTLLDKALLLYRQALSIHTRKSHPLQWALLKSKEEKLFLALALNTNDPAHAQKAKSAFIESMRILQPDHGFIYIEAEEGLAAVQKMIH